jgi:hypothetical protein
MPLVTVVRNQIQQGATARYERLIRFVAQRAQQDKDTFNWDTRISTGSQGRVISFVTTVEGFAELATREQPDDMIRRLFGEGDGNAILEGIGEAVQSTAYTIGAVREDLSTLTFPQQGTPISLSVVTRLRTTATGRAGTEELIRRVGEAASKVDEQRRYLVLQTAIGDLRNFAVVQPVADPAQLDRQAPVPELLNEAYGQKEGEKIFQEGSACFESIESELSVLRPEFSNRPA